MRETKPKLPPDRAEPRHPEPAKALYQSPRLIEYGSIGKLTQGGSGAFSEAVGRKQHQCL